MKNIFKIGLLASAALIVSGAIAQAEEIESAAPPLVEETELTLNPEAEVPSEDASAEQFIPTSQLSDNGAISPDRSLDPAVPDPLDDLAQDPFIPASRLSDVRPTDWAYQALQSLISNYDCLVGYPDGTFRGNRPLSRYEFAAGLNACLEQINRLIAAGTAEWMTQDDLKTLEKLMSDFEAELISLGTRIDSLEARTGFLEDHQFSTTTKLSGRVEIATTTPLGDRKAVPSGQLPTEDLVNNPVFGGLALLDLKTSFTGRDLLRAKLKAGNLNSFGARDTGTDMTLLAYGLNTAAGLNASTGNNLVLGTVTYQFPLSDNAIVMVGAKDMFFDSIIPNFNYAETLSLFGIGNPIYLLSFGAGAGINYQVNDFLNLSAAYLASQANGITPGTGLFNGQYGVMGQITLNFSEDFAIGLSYVHTYSPEPGGTVTATGFTGSQFAQLPFGRSTATSTNAFSFEVGYQVTPTIGVGAWTGYINAIAESSPQLNGFNAPRGADADIWYWAVAAEVLDVFQEGSELGLIFGMPPKLTGNSVPGRRDLNTSYHFEAYYAYPLTDSGSIYVTPGFFVVLDPEHNSSNNDIWFGSLVFSFYF